MNAEETVAWLAGFVSARYRKDINPRPNQDQWEHIVKMLRSCSPEDGPQYNIGLNCS